MPTQPDVIIRQWFEELCNPGREDTIDRIIKDTITSRFVAA